MKLTAISTALALLASLGSATAHTSMMIPPTRSHPKNPNAANIDFNCIMAPLETQCGRKPFPCGGYPQDKKIVTTLKAGQVVDVQFWNSNFDRPLTAADANADQARHSGGLCEFSLSYDGGKTFHVIGVYTKTCPDIFFKWPVLIPANAPSCTTPGKCLFVWSWINATGNREFYMNCADVFIEGKAKGTLPKRDITRANLPGRPGFEKILSPPGDDRGNQKGAGPDAIQIKANKNGSFSGGAQSNDPPAGEPEPASTTTAGKPTGKPGKPPKETPADPAPTGAPSDRPSNGGACSADQQGCDGKNFLQCVNGRFLSRPCAPGTVCVMDGTTATCGFAA